MKIIFMYTGQIIILECMIIAICLKVYNELINNFFPVIGSVNMIHQMERPPDFVLQTNPKIEFLKNQGYFFKSQKTTHMLAYSVSEVSENIIWQQYPLRSGIIDRYLVFYDFICHLTSHCIAVPRISSFF